MVHNQHSSTYHLQCRFDYEVYPQSRCSRNGLEALVKVQQKSGSCDMEVQAADGRQIYSVR